MCVFFFFFSAVKQRQSEIKSLIQLESESKRARSHGEAYITKSGKQKPKRQMRLPCPSTCRLKCSERIDGNDRTIIFKEFWSLPNRWDQWNYISMNIFLKPKDKATTKETTVISRRWNSRIYHLTLDDEQILVCKTMFLNTLGINHSWIHTVCKKLLVHGYISKDERGQNHLKRKKKNRTVDSK